MTGAIRIYKRESWLFSSRGCVCTSLYLENNSLIQCSFNATVNVSTSSHYLFAFAAWTKLEIYGSISSGNPWTKDVLSIHGGISHPIFFKNWTSFFIASAYVNFWYFHQLKDSAYANMLSNHFLLDSRATWFLRLQRKVATTEVIWAPATIFGPRAGRSSPLGNTYFYSLFSFISTLPKLFMYHPPYLCSSFFVLASAIMA